MALNVAPYFGPILSLFYLLLLWAQPSLILAEAPAAQYPKAPKTLLLDITAHEDLILAVGQRGHILRSSDGGDHFSLQHSPTAHTLTSILAISPTVILAAGHHLTLIRSTDAGQTWSALTLDHSDSSPWLDLLALDHEYIIAIGAYGHLATSKDQGLTWTVDFATGEDFHLNAIAQIGPNKLAIAGEAGRIYISADRGESWRAFEPPYEGSFFAVEKVAYNKALFLGLRGKVLLGDFTEPTPRWTLTTTAAEQSWFGVSAAREQGAFWLVGAGGQFAFLKSTDLLQKHARKRIPAATTFYFLNRFDRANLAKVLSHRDQLWTAGENGLVRYEKHISSSASETTPKVTEIKYTFKATPAKQ
jgi:photosystem II stability/assembly factor-like uncharacterized protein